MRVPRGGIDFVPPAQADEAAAGDVFEVVEVGGEEEHSYYKDEDAVTGGWVRLVGKGSARRFL